MFASLVLLGLTTAPAPAGAAPTARASGVLAVHTGPGDVYPVIDKLDPGGVFRDRWRIQPNPQNL